MIIFSPRGFILCCLRAFLLFVPCLSATAALYDDWFHNLEEPAPFTRPATTEQSVSIVFEELRKRGFSSINLAESADTLYLSVFHTRISGDGRAIGRAARILTYLAPEQFETLVLCLNSEVGVRYDCLSFKRDMLDRYFERQISKYQLRAYIRSEPCSGDCFPESSSAKQFGGQQKGRGLLGISYHSEATDAGHLDSDIFAGYNLYQSNTLTVKFNPVDISLMLNDKDGDPYADFFSSLSFKQWLSAGTFVAGRALLRWWDPDDPSESDSQLPHVVSDIDLYRDNDQFKVDQLYIAHSQKIAENWFFNTTVGYQHEMFAGFASQLLWANVLPNTSIDFRLDWLKQRDIDSPYTLMDGELLSSTLGVHWNSRKAPWVNTAEIYVGRFLAEDYGLRAQFGHRFGNGITLSFWYGATDSDDYEGSGALPMRTRGLQLTIPLGSLRQKDTRRAFNVGYMSEVRDSAQLLGRPVDLTDRDSFSAFSRRPKLNDFGQ